MSLWKIAWRNLWHRPLASSLTMASMMLGVLLVVLVLVVSDVVKTHFQQGATGFHLIVGAKGGKLQLVFNTVYHLSQPIENIPWSLYKEFTEGRYKQVTRAAIPYCLGDSYEDPQSKASYRVVGTSPDLFDKIEYGRRIANNAQGYESLRYRFAQGRNLGTEAENYHDAVIGSVVAYQTGLKIGDKISPTHGIVEEGGEAHKHEHDQFTVVGILEPTGTPNDRAVFVHLEGFLLIPDHRKGSDEPETPAEKPHDHADHEHGDDEHGHDHDQEKEHAHDHGHDHGHDHAHGPVPESERELTAILVLATNDVFSQQIAREINKSPSAQAVSLVGEVTNFVDTFIGPLEKVLLLLTALVIITAGISIMVSIYNSMSERSRDIAVMRALGAGQFEVMLIILFESALLALGGGALGLLLAHGLLAVVNPFMQAMYGISLNPLQFSPLELVLVPGLLLLATAAGYLPALTAYRTDVARSLANNP